MAAITSIEANQIGAFTAGETILSASDTINFNASRKQLLVLRNPTGGSLTATIDGADGTTVNVAGVGAVSVAAGYGVTVAAGTTKAVVLGSVSAYCQGVVSITGAAGMAATLFNL
jgi:hypothetical protein